MDDDDQRALENQIMERPEAGAVVPGTGGLRKLRFAPSGGGKGKRGSERVCYALYPAPGIVVLVFVYGKGEKADLTAVEKKQIKALLDQLGLEFKKKGAGR
ncbi:MAG: hypothetical protein P4L85_23050 [Paludisphaera borealis]|uniref:hypothetical protein n=1 Tax=Paludisphaera borealis TaxID=1387353 RepID=UPI00284D8E33|nr:hypothetical protein [Paludisphaera borealis]MDR3622247.1 hypothetical protein [Paludisphaera borealis]